MKLTSFEIKRVEFMSLQVTFDPPPLISKVTRKHSHRPLIFSSLPCSPGGDSKTLMIVEVAPVEKNVGETVASLSFAQRVRSVELGQASRKLDGDLLVDSRERLSHCEVGKHHNEVKLLGHEVLKIRCKVRLPGYEKDFGNRAGEV